MDCSEITPELDLTSEISSSDSALYFVSCPKCNSIPYISINTLNYTTVTITCPNPKCRQVQIMSITDYIKYLQENSSKTTSKGKKCECLLSHNQQGNEAESFCVHCHQWLCHICIQNHREMQITKDHLIMEYSLNEKVVCDKHNNRPYDYFCTQDNMHLCSECYLEHKEHQGVVKIKEYLNEGGFKQINNEFAEQKKKINEENKKIKDTIVALLEKQIEDVKKAYEENKTINDNLHNLINVLFNNASWNLDNYYLKWNLKKNTNFIQLDNAQCQVNDTSLNYIEQIKNFFKRSYLIGENSEIKDKEIVPLIDLNKGEETDKEIKQEKKINPVKQKNVDIAGKNNNCIYYIVYIIVIVVFAIFVRSLFSKSNIIKK